ncbi:CPBP family intramembrane glutamic endopeptidase [Metabacillus arenae]|uniref:CPBP family intramembrane metalloprotease n=1 Tax=Metabacillus arenae TaxID=2771434 RepID=A0A926RZ46_9BACI|nr:type II CAAX endopeptidase family protein [Metabacillus arenae]MBD1378694.1 CPBP family intramembrane metalloprotease [Metabacillus arenae]
MLKNNFVFENLVCLILFTSIVIVLQIHHVYLLIIWSLFSAFCLMTFSMNRKLFIVTTFFFGIGYYLYLTIGTSSIIQRMEMKAILDRILLVFILIPLLIIPFIRRTPFILYWHKPDWNNTIYFPGIWSGFHQIKIKYFLFIAITINFLGLLPFYTENNLSTIGNIILIAVLFSIINAVLEELIWRGFLLSQFSEFLGDKWAVTVTSLGFGFQHYSLGFSWPTCLFFSIGGFFYGGLTIKSKSIIPAIIWHFVLNILMVLSGIITFD